MRRWKIFSGMFWCGPFVGDRGFSAHSQRLGGGGACPFNGTGSHNRPAQESVAIAAVFQVAVCCEKRIFIHKRMIP